MRCARRSRFAGSVVSPVPVRSESASTAARSSRTTGRTTYIAGAAESTNLLSAGEASRKSVAKPRDLRQNGGKKPARTHLLSQGAVQCGLEAREPLENLVQRDDQRRREPDDIRTRHQHQQAGIARFAH